jgi:hypothetical protein
MSEAMFTTDQARRRVAAGATLLDARQPDWFSRLDVGRLDLHSACRCIVGQVYGDYDVIVGGALSDVNSEHHGFTLNCTPFEDDDEAWRMLQDAWIEAIADRLVTGAATERQAVHVQEPVSSERAR